MNPNSTRFCVFAGFMAWGDGRTMELDICKCASSTVMESTTTLPPYCKLTVHCNFSSHLNHWTNGPQKRKERLQLLKLHGFSSSNYYNVPKLALLEKNIDFEEVVSYTGVGPKYRPEYLDKSPLGKVPALETEDGFISESRAILEYIERAYPQPALLPDTPFGIAKVQELSQFVELYFELVARRLIPNLLGNTEPDPTVLQEVETSLTKAAAALGKLSSFSTFAYGDQFTLADIAVILNLPIVRGVGSRFMGGDPLADVPGLTAYCERMEERPHVKTIRADAAADQPGFRAHLKALYGI